MHSSRAWLTYSNAATSAKALFPYTGNSAEELPFEEGDTLSIVDHSEDDWWKAEKDGVIFIVPAAYLEMSESDFPLL